MGDLLFRTEIYWLMRILNFYVSLLTVCSTVLLPARVVQALNLNLDDMGAQPQFQPRFNANFTPDSGNFFFIYNCRADLLDYSIR